MRCSCLLMVALFSLSILALTATSAAQGIMIPSTGYPGLDQYRASRISVYTDDYGQLARYRDANAVLRPTTNREDRVVFFGDSITDFWPLSQSFPAKPYINRGIGGQTTSQMLLRFRQDVINLKPKVVIILAGANDIAGNTGPIADEDIEANFSSLAELALAHDVRVILSSLLPVHNYTSKAQEFFASRPPDRILTLNRWLKEYCATNKLEYLDYFRAMVDDKGLMRSDLADDGLHPNRAGYAIMAPLAEKAIAEALAQRTAADSRMRSERRPPIEIAGAFVH